MKRILISLALLFITSAAVAESPLQKLAFKRAWAEACTATPYSCVGVTPPKVVYEKMEPGLRGWYDGGDTIYINTQLRPGMDREGTLYHEMIHFLQERVGTLVLPGPAKQVCEAEAEAFALTDKWKRQRGYTWMVRGPNWWRSYSHCRKYYDPNYEDYSQYGGWGIFFSHV